MGGVVSPGVRVVRLLACWGALVLLSVGTVMSGAAGLWWIVVLAAVAKAWMITDGFMELRHAPLGWRAAMLAWPVVLVMGIVVMH
ncbi:cytochrome C oxidase subunit IV family protein [Pseudomonas sp. WS 5059]|uniref:cytochrome C oxidase subunit IV family protein n=1 Tax=unclassified Pseudomonas TaxID=196821 RepID=UPI001473239B|nr:MULTISPECIES: cytochrome C oxidase subunit IV family protein [unclassified Pseudomonas]NMX60575.1 cytochrome C oxidase subunit IV family protein [Pseudomonas sp. WS 5079]NMY01688.1 cytochrome C oxidase subunit IV family protein [Pseudomonas sp. WS 5059]